MVDAYRLLTRLASPFMPFWLAYRSAYGKEDPRRIRERYGVATIRRPPGTLLWLHAASVGEATSVLPLIEQVRHAFPQLVLLLTTGTVTSAQLMRQRLPKGVIHQYAPIDTPQAVMRFMRYWKPAIGLWVESEFWPNLIRAARARHCFMGVINGRMSARSFAAWQKREGMIKQLLQCFSFIAAQSEQDEQRFKTLGAQDTICLGNLKYDAAPLPCDESELIRLRQAIGSRPLWLAASTHEGEEDFITEAHARLLKQQPNLLLIIVPRHPPRGITVAALLQKQFRVSRRAPGDAINADTQCYIADTLGELGLFYRLCEIVFMGGSLVPRGGQNPLEPARLACSIITGAHTENFSTMFTDMEQAAACVRVGDAAGLAAQVQLLLRDSAKQDAMQAALKAWLAKKGGATARLLELLTPVFLVP